MPRRMEKIREAGKEELEAQRGARIQRVEKGERRLARRIALDEGQRGAPESGSHGTAHEEIQQLVALAAACRAGLEPAALGRWVVRAIPAVDWLPSWRLTWKRDAIAGLAVWAVLVPQGMAYAALAGGVSVARRARECRAYHQFGWRRVRQVHQCRHWRGQGR